MENDKPKPFDEQNNDSEIVPSHSDDSSNEIASNMADSLGLTQQNFDLDINLQKDAVAIPKAELASLGSAFASLPQVFRTSTTTVSVQGHFYQLFDPQGNPVPPELLQHFKHENANLASVYDKQKKQFAYQARVKSVDSLPTEIKHTVPYNPTDLMVAAALMEINKKLDDIQETQQEMFNYLKDKDKAAQRANLKTLVDVLDEYRFNAGSETFKNSKHILIQGIRKDAEEQIIFWRGQTKRALEKKQLLQTDGMAAGQLSRVVDDLKEYRLALYLYSFSTLLEVMLLENFEGAYLDKLVEGIRQHMYDYKNLYTRCYDALEAGSKSSLESALSQGLSFAGKSLGSAIKKTPLGDATLIDETLIDASEDLNKSRKEKTSNLMLQLTAVKDTDVVPFIDTIEKANALYNKPALVFSDEDTVYFLNA